MDKLIQKIMVISLTVGSFSLYAGQSWGNKNNKKSYIPKEEGGIELSEGVLEPNFYEQKLRQELVNKQKTQKKLDNALIEAAKECDLKKIKKLIDLGANVLVKDIEGNSLLHLVVLSKCNKAIIVNYFINQGINIHHKNKMGWAAGHYATFYLLEEVVKCLIGHNFDLNCTNNRNLNILDMVSGYESRYVNDMLDNSKGFELKRYLGQVYQFQQTGMAVFKDKDEIDTSDMKKFVEKMYGECESRTEFFMRGLFFLQTSKHLEMFKKVLGECANKNKDLNYGVVINKYNELLGNVTLLNYYLEKDIIKIDNKVYKKLPVCLQKKYEMKLKKN